jgi:curved DNA-binding protein CbpA
MDAYHILNIKLDASIDEIKQRFYKLTQLYHPDKGGNAATYMKYKEAYQTILKNKQSLKPRKEKTFSAMCAERSKPVLKSSSHKPVTPKEFQRKFQEAEVHNNTGYTYNLARNDRSERSERSDIDFRNEYNCVTNTIKKVKPFTKSRSSFNSKDFNDAFILRKKKHIEQNKQLEEIITEPEPIYLDSHYANNSASLDNPQHIYGKDNYSQFDGAYNQHENPMDDSEEDLSNNDEKKFNDIEIRKELAEMRKIMDRQEQIILRLIKNKVSY